MRILLDECVPVEIGELPALAAHSVQHVGRSPLAGLSNGSLIEAASRDFDVFVTCDRHFMRRPDLQPRPGLAIICVRTSDNTLAVIRPAVEAFLAAVPLPDVLGKLSVVWRDHWEIR